MKEIIERNGIVFVRNGTRYMIYGVKKSFLIRISLFSRIGNIYFDDEKESYYFSPFLFTIGLGNNSLKTISEFVEKLNKQIKYLGE